MRPIKYLYVKVPMQVFLFKSIFKYPEFKIDLSEYEHDYYYLQLKLDRKLLLRFMQIRSLSVKTF